MSGEGAPWLRQHVRCRPVGNTERGRAAKPSSRGSVSWRGRVDVPPHLASALGVEPLISDVGNEGAVF
jgi:hypothetical protein